MKSVYSFPLGRTLCGSLVCSILSVPSLAADPPAGARELEEIVVSASRMPMPQRRIGSSVTRLEEDDIARRSAFSLAEVLRTVPGVGVSGTGGLGKPQTLRIRGEEGYRTLLLIDGMDVSDPTPPQMAPRIQHVPTVGVAAVEVLRGAQGMMYGADAGGVLSVETRRPENGVESRVRVDTGRYDSEQLFADLGIGGEQGGLYLAATELTSDGFNARSDDLDLKDDDGYTNKSIHGRAGWQPSEELRVQAVFRGTNASNEYDDCYGLALTHDCRNDFRQRAARFSVDHEGDVIAQRFAVQKSTLDSRDKADGRDSFASEGEIAKAEYLGRMELPANTALLYGLDYKREQMDSDGSTQSRGQRGYYLEYQGAFGADLFLSAGIRLDDNDDFGRHDSYRIAAAYLVPVTKDHLLRLKSSAGTGFRAPSLYELAYNASPWAAEPASGVSLSEEQSRSFDLGFEYYIADHTRLDLVFFDQRIRDEIYYDLVAYSGYLQSRGTSESRGFEFSARYQPSDFWALTGNFTYNRTETVDGEARIQRPRQMAHAGLSLFPFRELALQLNWRASRDARAHDGSALDDYSVVDLNGRYPLSDALVVYSRIENVLNEDYQEVLGYNTPGRAAYLGAQVNF
ncbi:TonB-dependent receptor plug domain-containing protein [Gilvimarinus sp. F26214L]|uniref:TonB-dependent receptor plug domain-containing protein n=1 Tax=Gilvimarinus sp. DZF01 TaxID=3461371 RepID=UPI004045AF7A